MAAFSNKDIIGYAVFQEIKYFEAIHQFDALKKRLKGLLKKNNNELSDSSQDKVPEDDVLWKKVDEFSSMDTYEKKYQWLQANEAYLLKFLDDYKIKGHQQREKLMQPLLGVVHRF
jgi:hypothetical protein